MGRVGIEWYYTGHTEPGRESVPSDERAVHDSRAPGGKTVRAHSAVRQRREPHRCAADALGSAASPDARGRRPLDRRCVGAARRPQHQRRLAGSILAGFGDRQFADGIAVVSGSAQPSLSINPARGCESRRESRARARSASPSDPRAASRRAAGPERPGTGRRTPS